MEQKQEEQKQEQLLASHDNNEDDNEDVDDARGKADEGASVDDSDDDDDDDDSLSIVVLEGPPPMKLEKPSEGLQWDDLAIDDCFRLAIATHDAAAANASDEALQWNLPPLGNMDDNDFLSTWQPKPLSLPLWAVQPFTTIDNED